MPLQWKCNSPLCLPLLIFRRPLAFDSRGGIAIDFDFVLWFLVWSVKDLSFYI